MFEVVDGANTQGKTRAHVFSPLLHTSWRGDRVVKTENVPYDTMTTPPTPLPEKESPSGLYTSAYEKCRHRGFLALDNSNSSLQITKPPALVAARLLGYLLLPTVGRREKPAKEINSTSDSMLFEVAQIYITPLPKPVSRAESPHATNLYC